MVELVNVVTLVLQATLLATVALGIRQRNVSIVVNGVVATIAALLPVAVMYITANWYDGGIVFSPMITFWVALAGVAHQFGMLGLYDGVWWWDHFTHTLSASFIAAALYAGFLSLTMPPVRLTIPLVSPAGATVLLVFIVGIFWELIEAFGRTLAYRFDFEPVLLHYGPGDTELDLLFDVAGALIVVGFDVRLLVPLTRQFPYMTRSVVVIGTGFVLVSSVLMALVVLLDGTGWSGSDGQ